ncbi:MAG: catechol 1,2-dioxygenase [Acidimicrobiia bacterium]|nr:catechol 1,2-dioxygenase [Acidimicrobiia bacterium]
MANQRTSEVVEALTGAIRGVIKDKGVDYDEFHAAVSYLQRLADSGEIPLLLAVLFEATVDEVTHANSVGSTTTIEGPFYVAGAPVLDQPYKLPRRPDELGDVLVVSGTVRATDGQPVAAAELDMWQATGELPGKYSNVHPGIPDWNLRGRFHADDQGRFKVETVLPAPYEIRKGGPTEELLTLVGRHTWRPSHLHFKVRHPGYRTLTTQLFFSGGAYLDSDAGNAVKPDLIIPLTKLDESRGPDEERLGFTADYHFVLEPQP